MPCIGSGRFHNPRATPISPHSLASAPPPPSTYAPSLGPAPLSFLALIPSHSPFPPSPGPSRTKTGNASPLSSRPASLSIATPAELNSSLTSTKHSSTLTLNRNNSRTPRLSPRLASVLAPTACDLRDRPQQQGTRALALPQNKISSSLQPSLPASLRSCIPFSPSDMRGGRHE